MALHRDIYWVGRQWAVTGLGMQAVDQRLKGAFDIEIARLWEDDLPQRMRALAWLNIDDFNKGLELARERFPRPPRKVLPLVESVLELIPPAATTASEPPKQTAPIAEVRPVPAAQIAEVRPVMTAPAPIELPRSQPPMPPQQQPPTPPQELPTLPQLQTRTRPLQLQIGQVSAKFVPAWRIRHNVAQSQKGGVTGPG